MSSRVRKLRATLPFMFMVILVHIHGYAFTFTVLYSFTSFFVLSNTAEEACLSIAGSKDASVAILHLQLNFP